MTHNHTQIHADKAFWGGVIISSVPSSVPPSSTAQVSIYSILWVLKITGVVPLDTVPVPFLLGLEPAFLKVSPHLGESWATSRIFRWALPPIWRPYILLKSHTNAKCHAPTPRSMQYLACQKDNLLLSPCPLPLPWWFQASVGSGLGGGKASPSAVTHHFHPSQV